MTTAASGPVRGLPYYLPDLDIVLIVALFLSLPILLVRGTSRSSLLAGMVPSFASCSRYFAYALPF